MENNSTDARVEILKIGVPTANNRVYTKECAENIVETINKHEKGRILIQPEGSETNSLKTALGIVEDAELEGDSVMVFLYILDTPEGRHFKETVLSKDEDKRIPVRFYTCGHGNCSDPDERGVCTVEDYTLDYVVCGRKLDDE